MKKFVTQLRFLFLFILLPSSFILACSGCTWVHGLTSKVLGPEPIEAQYVPAPEPMLVLVENFRSGSTAELDADMLTRYLNDELTAHNIAPIIEFEQLATLRTDATPFCNVDELLWRGATESFASCTRRMEAPRLLDRCLKARFIRKGSGSDELAYRDGA